MKQTFAAKTFASHTFASGNWAGVGSSVVGESGTPTRDVFTADNRGETFIGIRSQTFQAPTRGQTYEGQMP